MEFILLFLLVLTHVVLLLCVPGYFYLHARHSNCKIVCGRMYSLGCCRHSDWGFTFVPPDTLGTGSPGLPQFAFEDWNSLRQNACSAKCGLPTVSLLSRLGSSAQECRFISLENPWTPTSVPLALCFSATLPSLSVTLLQLTNTLRREAVPVWEEEVRWGGWCPLSSSKSWPSNFSLFAKAFFAFRQFFKNNVLCSFPLPQQEGWSKLSSLLFVMGFSQK